MVKLNYGNFDNEIKFYSMISYIGPLFILSRIFNKGKNYLIDFHSWYGGILFFAVSFLYSIIKFVQSFIIISPILAEIVILLLHTGVLTLWVVLMMMGLVSAYKMQTNYLPIIGWIDSILKKHYNFK